VTGFVTCLLEVFVYWRAKSQKGVTLSSTEVEEYVKNLKQLRKSSLSTIC
jgi:hypothetical protein